MNIRHTNGTDRRPAIRIDDGQEQPDEVNFFRSWKRESCMHSQEERICYSGEKAEQWPRASGVCLEKTCVNNTFICRASLPSGLISRAAAICRYSRTAAISPKLCLCKPSSMNTNALL